MTASEIQLIQAVRSNADPELAVKEVIAFLSETAKKPPRPDMQPVDSLSAGSEYR